MNGKPWTTSDEQLLREQYGKVPTAQIASAMGRTVKSVTSRAKVLKIRTRELLTPEQIERIRQLHGTMTARQIAQSIGRSLSAVHNACHRLALGRGTRVFHGEAFAAFVREKHALGWSDTAIAAAYGERIGRVVDRHSVTRWRDKLGLPSVLHSEHQRNQVREKTAEQLKAAGVASLAELRGQVFRERAAAAGWPEDLRPRAVQILNALWERGPMTRMQIAEAIGMPWKGSRKSLTSNDPEGSYLAHLMSRGLVIVMKRAAKVTGQGKGRSQNVYSLPLTIERKQIA